MPDTKNLVAGGTNVRLDCPYSGYPIETISWYKDGMFAHVILKDDFINILVSSVNSTENLYYRGRAAGE